MKDIKDQIQVLKDYLCTIDYIRGKLAEALDDIKQAIDSLDNHTYFIFSDYFNDLQLDICRNRKFLELQYSTIENEIKALEHTLPDASNESTGINPEYIKEFEEMLSDGDVPF